jgi:hypothetical protein
MAWISVQERLPDHLSKVLCYLPDNVQYIGKTDEIRPEPVVILRFVANFFGEGNEKREKHGPHFWAGEGLSNHYMADVTHWMPLPEAP